MTERVTYAAAAALAVVALGLGASACGNGGQSAEEAAAKRLSEARWRTGLTQWSTQMIGALNGISIMLSGSETVGRLQKGDVKTVARLDRLEGTLTGCTLALRHLGTPPELFVPARGHASQACASLQSGAQLVHKGVAEWRTGGGLATIRRATETLSEGQRGVVRVQRDLEATLQG